MDASPSRRDRAEADGCLGCGHGIWFGVGDEKRDEKKRQTKLRKVGLGEEKKVDPCALLLTAIEEMEEEEE
jgi:hypothetical protein